MRSIVIMFAVLGALAASALVARTASAQSLAECRAACNARYNPVDVEKTDRWRVDGQRHACLARCGR